MPLKFSKYQGTGNDFIIFDNRDGRIDHKNTQWFRHICDRRFGIGADGVMLLENEAGYDFKMVYYNADGNISSMCGNGGRCLANYALRLGIVKDEYTFVAVDGPHTAYVKNGIVHLKMNDVLSVTKGENYYFLDTGSPHYVQFVEDVMQVDIKSTGAAIRYAEQFKPGGTNANFIDCLQNQLHIRTYERGVEDETLSCGTGVTASALAYAINNALQDGKHTITLQTMGGELQVQFDLKNGQFTDVWLIGPGELVFEGEI